MNDYEIIFFGRFDASPYDIQKFIHEFSKTYSDDPDYLIVTSLDDTVIFVDAYARPYQREYISSHKDLKKHYGYLDMLYPITGKPELVTVMIFSSPGYEFYWNDFILELKSQYFLHPSDPPIKIPTKEPSKKSKRGPRTKSKAEKLAALEAWDALDRDIHAVTLREWLDNRYGLIGDNCVAVPTFYGWRKQVRENEENN